jgi:hypothetical protein
MMRGRLISETEIGKKYGRLTITRIIGKDGLVECRCDCGNIKVKRLALIMKGIAKSCGCLSKEKQYKEEDYIGKKFGRLTILGIKKINEPRNAISKHFKCVCDCGNMITVRCNNLCRMKTKSCGCFFKDINSSGTNNDIFKNTDNEEDAYWIGFLMADGCVSKNGNTITIGLQSSDRRHLEKFKAFVESSNKIRDCSRVGENKDGKIVYYSSRFSFNSEDVKKTLSLHGVVPQKSIIARPSDEIVKNKHFWRGMIDGDGSLFTKYYKENNKKYVRLDLCGSNCVVSSFISYIKRTLYISANIYPNGRVFHVRFAGIRAKKIIEHLYKDSTIYLDRKKLLADQYILDMSKSSI